MILTCSSCATRYMADAVSFQPSGRRVRCIQCGHTWHQSPPADLALKALPDLTGSSAFDINEFQPRTTQSGRLLWLGQLVGWLLLLGVMIGLSSTAYGYRVQIVKLWPESSILYTAFGLSVNTRGLTFRNASYQEETYGNVPALVVMGEIMNTTNIPQLVPDIRISLRDGREREIFDWTADPPIGELAAGEIQFFVTRLTRPPQNAQDLVIRFAEAPNGQSD